MDSTLRHNTSFIYGTGRGRRYNDIESTIWFKGCGMGPWLVLVSPCFRENVVATCKIGSFLCSLDNLLQKNVLFFFLEIKFRNGAHLKKGLFLTYFSHFLVTRKSYKNSFSTYHKHIHTRILLTLLTFLPYQIMKKNTNLSECLLLICTYTDEKFIVICKPRTLNDGGEDSVKYSNRKKHRFLAAAILLFIGKIMITW